MGMLAPGFRAGGTIEVSRFVKMGSADFTVVQAAAGTDMPIGVSQDGSHDTPGLSGSTDDAARSGHPLQVYVDGDVCLLCIGSGGVTRGDKIVSDANGKGVTAPTTGTSISYVGAVALESASENELARVLLKTFAIRPALT